MKFIKLLKLSNKLIEFDEFYLFDKKEKWGTKKDWAKHLYNGDYNSTIIKKFINNLINKGILTENKKTYISGKYHQTYKLKKRYIEDVYMLILEKREEMKYVDELYNLVRKYVRKPF